MKSKLLLLLATLVGQGNVSAQTVTTPVKEQVIVLSKSNVVVLNDAIMPNTMGAIIQNIKQLDQKLSDDMMNKARERVSGKKTSLYIFLNSPGGSIQTGLEFAEFIRGLGRPVHTITLFSASMAFQFVQQLGDRYVLSNGVMMSHRARGGFEGEFGGQSPSQMDNRQALWLSRLQEMDQQTVNRSKGKQTLESYQKAYASEMWRTGTQSTQQGYSDAVAVVRCDASLAGVENKEVSIDLGFMKLSVSFDLDLCPLNTNPMNIKVLFTSNKGKITLDAFQASGGDFGPSCLQMALTDKNKLCAANPLLNATQINQKIEEFKNQGKFDFRNWKMSEIKTVW